MNELVAAVPWLGKRNPTAARWLIILVALVSQWPALRAIRRLELARIVRERAS